MYYWFQAHMLGLLSSPSQPLPPRGKGSEQAGHDLRVKLSKQRQLLVMNVMDRDELISYFDVSLGMLTFKVQRDSLCHLHVLILLLLHAFHSYLITAVCF